MATKDTVWAGMTRYPSFLKVLALRQQIERRSCFFQEGKQLRLTTVDGRNPAPVDR